MADTSFSVIPGSVQNDERSTFSFANTTLPAAVVNRTVVQEILSAMRRRSRDSFRHILETCSHPEVHLSAEAGDADQNTVLHLLVLIQDEEMLHTAMKFGPPVNKIENREGLTPLTLAAARGLGTSFRILYREGYEVNPKRISSTDKSLLHYLVAADSSTKPWPERIQFIEEIASQDRQTLKQLDQEGFSPRECARNNFLWLGNDGTKILELLERKKKPKDFREAQMEDLPTLLRSPKVRILTVLVLMLLHCLSYSMETVDRTHHWETPINSTKEVKVYHPATFAFIFAVANFIGSEWSDVPSNLLGIRIGCIVGGVVVGVLVATLIVWLLFGRVLLRLRVFGYDEEYAAIVEMVQESRRQALEGWEPDPPSYHTMALWYVSIVGAFCGLYGGAIAYNVVIDQRYSDYTFAKIGSRITAKPSEDFFLTNVAALRGYWIASLVVDWWVLVYILDVMMQQAVRRVGLPQRNSFSTFGEVLRPSSTVESIDETQQGGTGSSSAHDISISKRLLIYYGLLVAGWLVILIPFGVASFEWGTPQIFAENAYLPARHAAQIALPGLCYFFSAVIVAQEWTLPREVHLPASLWIPGTTLYSETIWGMIFLLTITATMDLRLVVEQAEAYFNDNRGGLRSDGWQRFELGMALVPAAAGAGLLLLSFLQTSARCGKPNTAGLRSAASDSEAMSNHAKVAVLASHYQRRNRSQSVFLQRNEARTTASEGESRAFHAVPQHSFESAKKKSMSPSRTRGVAIGGGTSVDDVWNAALRDDVVRLCAMLDKDPSLVNAKGGPGIECDTLQRQATVCGALHNHRAEYSATPLHYCIVGGARSTAQALLARGANPRLRTTHGLFNCEELTVLSGQAKLFPDMISAPPPTAASMNA